MPSTLVLRPRVSLSFCPGFIMHPPSLRSEQVPANTLHWFFKLHSCWHGLQWSACPWFLSFHCTVPRWTKYQFSSQVCHAVICLWNVLYTLYPPRMPLRFLPPLPSNPCSQLALFSRVTRRCAWIRRSGSSTWRPLPHSSYLFSLKNCLFSQQYCSLSEGRSCASPVNHVYLYTLTRGDTQ